MFIRCVVETKEDYDKLKNEGHEFLLLSDRKKARSDIAAILGT